MYLFIFPLIFSSAIGVYLWLTRIQHQSKLSLLKTLFLIIILTIISYVPLPIFVLLFVSQLFDDRPDLFTGYIVIFVVGLITTYLYIVLINLFAHIKVYFWHTFLVATISSGFGIYWLETTSNFEENYWAFIWMAGILFIVQNAVRKSPKYEPSLSSPLTE